MKKIEVTYRVWWCPWARRVKGQLPSTWNDMTAKQFITVVKAMRGKEIPSSEFYGVLMGIPSKLVDRLDSFQGYTIDSMLEWLGGDDAVLSRFIIPKIEKLRAPEDTLGNVTLQQFMTADTFHGYVTDTMKDNILNGDISLLCQFVAALYLRKNESYSVHEVRKTLFDMPGQNIRLVDISANATMLEKRADRELLWCVYVNWVLIKAWLSRVYPLLFPEGDADDKQERVKNAWLKTFDSFVGDDVAHMDEYREMNCMDAFRIMQNRLREAYAKKA